MLGRPFDSRLIDPTSNYEFFEPSMANNLSLPTDLTLQRQRGHFVEMEMSASARVRTENTSKFVDTIGEFEYSAHRGALGGGGART